MQNLYNDLENLLKNKPEFVVNNKLNKSRIANAAYQYNKKLLQVLLENEALKQQFFIQVGNATIFKQRDFLNFLNNKSFLKNSYTEFKNQIGLQDEQGEYFRENKNVVLAFPYKDCVLEGGQDKEEQKRDEIFYNETLAPDEITRLLDTKALTNFKLYDSKGEHALTAESEIDFSQQNLVIKGNNLLALHSLRKIKSIAGQVKLIYIDPPYNTGSDSFHYNDKFNHSTWLVFMKNRLEVAKTYLHNDGFIFVQIDDDEQAYLKVMMDEIFGRENFVTTICVKMSHLSGVKMAHKEKKLPKIKEHILMYCKNRNLIKLTPEYIPVSWDEAFDRYNSFIVKGNFNDDECNNWKVISLNQAIKNARINEKDEKAVYEFKMGNAHLIFRTSVNRNADYSKYPKEKISKVVKSEEEYYFIYNHEDINFASEKIKEIGGKKVPTSIVGDIWTDIGINNLSNEGGVSMRFGKKPEKLLARIMNMTTKKGDVVLDYHLGSGTTAAVAHKLRRRYIGFEQLEYPENGSVKRLCNVINGENVGLGNLIEWKGGGSFVYAELKRYNQQYIDAIEAAKVTEELVALYQQMKKEAFFRIEIDHEKWNNEAFEQLSFKEQKELLCECLDKNHLYVNLTEIEDVFYKMSEDDIALNKKFYNIS